LIDRVGCEVLALISVNCRIGPRPLLLNNVAMVDSHFIAARVSPEMKARLRTLAEQRQTSESALLKRLLEMTLAGVPEAHLDNTASVPRVARDARLYVRLWPDDQLLLAERAAARGMPAATYVSVLVRAHLRHMGPLPKDELQALKGAIAQLGAVGRNLNQIAHSVRQGGAPTGPRRQDVETMLRICTALRDHFKATLMANLRSWQDGYDSPRP
jgi:hypothetical protein